MQLNKPRWISWLGLSILFAVYFALVSLNYAFSQDYLIQDDARIHIVWLQRFSDSELFPNDFLANYFIYFAPWGFKVVYWLGSMLGVEPFFLAKLLPGFLGLITTIYIYYFTLEIIPQPFTAFLSSLLVTQLIWCNDDLISATPRAFIYPLFAAFLYYLATEKLFLCLLSMFLLGLFYPQVLLVEFTVLSLRLIQYNKKFNWRLTNEKKADQWWILGLITTAIALVPFSQRSPEWSTVVTAQQMQQLPEFNLYGRSFFYGVGWLRFLFAGDSGICLPIFPPIVWTGLALPLIINKLNLKIKNLNILGQVTVASLLMFLVAHLLLLKIHLPSRYTYHTLRIILAIASAIVLTDCLTRSLNWLKNKRYFHLLDKVAITLVTLFTINVIVFPMIPYILSHWCHNWRVGEIPAVYQYLAKQPKDIMLASLSNEVNNIPAFTQRSILIGEEFAFPYHPYYHREIQQRVTALIEAQYTEDQATLVNFIKQYQINFILLDKNAFTPEYLLSKNWLIYSSWQNTTKNAINKIKSNNSFLLPQFIDSCTVVSTKKANLLDTNCIINQP